MNKDLQAVLEFIQNSQVLTEVEKASLVLSIKKVDKELEIVNFKLDRTEKVKRTTGILLEETIEELELKNRELEIETALEKVRSAALAMRHPGDMMEVCKIISDQLQLLGIKDIRNVQTAIIHAHKGTYLNYQYFTAYDKSTVEETEYDKHPKVLEMVQEMKKSADAIFSGSFEGDELNVFREYRKQDKQFPDPILDESSSLDYYFCSIGQGGLGLSTYKPINEDSLEIFRRFHNVFKLAYRRFIDIEQAEAQVREAQIEAALERVRSKTMSMHNSHDVGTTVVTLFDEVLKLGLDKSIRCGIGILDKETAHMETWSATSYSNGEVDLKMGMLDMTIHPMLIGLKKAWDSGETCYNYDYIGDDVIRYYNALNNEPEYPFHVDLDTLPENEYHNSFFYSEGILFAFTENPITDEAAKVLNRFAGVFGQTYRRYLDLQKAEAQAREAIKQASLDRVRGQIASMRSTDDLQRITPLIWHELETLDVPFNRCGVFIVDEIVSKVRVYLTTPDGKPLGALNLPTDSNELIRKVVDHWRKKVVYTIHWNKNDFIDWMQSMIELGQIQNKVEYQGNTAPPESLDLHFIPVPQGMLYVGNNEPLSQNKIDLVKSLAEAFSTAYARYEDFKNLEEAKARVEKTLSDLKATQSQLIHTEKMASLGELTAGIAHEIQNPLNFVNNFSDVSVDLIEEMADEIENENIDDVKAIAGDLKQNLGKINFHGQRASSIVKGMLEHSRASAGKKEPTNINVLADEFLRLAYHGLRAKDNSFNADIKLEVDESLPKVNVIPQDIGRVLLNLINNAFYAVSAKALAKAYNGYKPEVSVNTRKMDNIVEIRVIDNGNGIPVSIKEKIFQPFFTTKPTGQGTGLGLSLSYDIITKGHDGDLKVETKEGEGTEFIVHLPIMKQTITDE